MRMLSVKDGSKSLTSKVGWSAVASIFSLLSRFIAQIIIARMLGPEGLGRTAYVFWLIEIANVFCSFGLTATLTRYLAEFSGQKNPELAARFARWVFVRYLMAALLGAVFVGVLFLRSSQYAGSKLVLPVLMALFLVNGLQAINQADLSGRQQFNFLARLNVASAIILLVGVFIGGYFFGVVGVLFGYVAGALIPAVYSFTMLRGFSFADKIDSDLEKRVWKFAFYTWLALLVSAFVWSRMEIFFLERYWGVSEVAMFTVGLTFVVMVQQVTNLFCGAFMAHFSQHIGTGNHGLVQRHYESVLRLAALFVMPLAFLGAAIVPVLLPLFFGEKFVLAIPSAIILTATAALAFSTINSTLIYAHERSAFMAVLNFIGAIVLVTAGFLIIPKFSVWGAVWARLFVQSSLFLFGMWYINRELHYQVPFVFLSRVFLSSVICGGVTWGSVYFLGSPFVLIVVIPLGIGVYIISLKFFKVIELTDAVHLENISTRFWKPIGVVVCGLVRWAIVK